MKGRAALSMAGDGYGRAVEGPAVLSMMRLHSPAPVRCEGWVYERRVSDYEVERK